MSYAMPNYGTSAFAGQSIQDQTDLQCVAAGSGGTGVLSGLAVSPSSGMTLAVASGTASYEGTTQTYAGGSVTLPAAQTQGDRRDIVIWQSSTNTVTYVQGANCGVQGWTLSASGSGPVKPAIPAGAVLLAEVYVAYNTTAVAAENIVDKRVAPPPPPTTGLGLKTYTGGGTLTVTQAISDQGAGFTGWYLDPRFVWYLSGTFTGISNFRVTSDMIGSIGWNGTVSYGAGYINAGTGTDGIAVTGASTGDAQGLMFERVVIVGTNANATFHLAGGQRNGVMRDSLVYNLATSSTSYGLIDDTADQSSTRNSEDWLFDNVKVAGFNPIGIGIGDTSQRANDTIWNQITTRCTGAGYAITLYQDSNHTFNNFYDRTVGSVGVLGVVNNLSTGSIYFRGGELLNNSGNANSHVLVSSGSGAVVLDGTSVTAVTNRTITDATLNGTTTLDDPAGSFTAADVGLLVSGPGYPIGTSIVTYVSATQVTTSNATTVSGTNQTVTLAPSTVSITAGKITVRARSAPKGTWDIGGTGALLVDDSSNSCGSLNVYGSGTVYLAPNGYPAGSPTISTIFTGTVLGGPVSANFKQTTPAITPSATANTYGTAQTVTPDANYNGFTVVAAQTVLSGLATETVTIQITPTWRTAGAGTPFTFTYSSNGTQALSDNSKINLWLDGDFLASFSVAVKSSISSSTASVTVTVGGMSLV